MISRRRIIAGGVAFAGMAVGAGRHVFAQNPQEVRIGAIYPLSGSNTSVGTDARHALDTAVEIINGTSDLNLPGANGIEIQNLGRATVKLILADHNADPQKGAAETERLITQEKVCAVVGAYHSAVSASASEVCERYSVPYIAADSTATNLHKRGFKYFFRPSANDLMFCRAMFDFLDAQKSTDKKIEKIALLYEDTPFGIGSAEAQRDLADVRGYKIAADIKISSNAASLTSEVQQLKAANADVLMPSCYTPGALLLVKAMVEQSYKPTCMIANAVGFADKALFDAAGDHLDGLISRANFALDIASKRPALLAVNDLFKKRARHDLNDNTSRQLMAVLILAHAINAAKSVEGPEIRAALAQTNIPGEETIMPWRYVKFAADGQSPTCDVILVQYLGGKYVTIFPNNVGVREAKWPMSS